MTDDERHEYTILKLANENGKFALEIAGLKELNLAEALERLQLREWIKLIDVAPVAAYPNKVFRVFMLTPPAKTWLRRQSAH